MDVELFNAISRYPFIHNGELFDSKELAQNKTCLEKCKDKDCVEYFSNNNKSGEEYVCSKGYNNLNFAINDFSCFVNGLIYDSNRTVPSGRKEVRKDWIVDRKKVIQFSDKIYNIENHVNKKLLDTTEKNFSMFHDFKTSMSILFNCTQDIISNLPGDSFNQKLENSDKSFKDLYNALELITSQLGMIDVILNPKSIEFGVKKRINLYRLFEKIKILFGHLSNKKQDITINIQSEGWVKDCYCYESIEFIPLILIDNALKYSVKDSEVEIKFEQHYNNLKIIVKNIGPQVKDENVSKIFEKFFRGETAMAFSKEGIGMGLWVAQQILQTHGSKLSYFKDKRENRTIGLNIFEFDIKTVD